MRRRHYLVVGEDRGLCGRNLGEHPLVDRGVTSWRQVDCLQCQVKRYLAAKKNYDKRKARELARAQRAVPLLEENMPTPDDNRLLHERLAVRKDAHLELLATRLEDLAQQHGEALVAANALDPEDLHEALAMRKPLDEVSDSYEVVPAEGKDVVSGPWVAVMHRLDGLEAQITALQALMGDYLKAQTALLNVTMKASQESQARDGYTQRELAAINENLRLVLEVVQRPLLVTMARAWGHLHQVDVRRELLK